MSHQAEPTMIEFFQYTHWANQELLRICIGLSDELTSTPIPGTYGSIRETFAHMLKAEGSFLKRIHGVYPHPDFQWEERPTLQQLTAYEDVLHHTLMDTLEKVTPEQNVHEEGNGWSFDYQARLIFMSVVYHGIAHRTDITTALNHQGVALPELVVWGYCAAFPQRFQSRLQKVNRNG